MINTMKSHIGSSLMLWTTRISGCLARDSGLTMTSKGTLQTLYKISDPMGMTFRLSSMLAGLPKRLKTNSWKGRKKMSRKAREEFHTTSTNLSVKRSRKLGSRFITPLMITMTLWQLTPMSTTRSSWAMIKISLGIDLMSQVSFKIMS